MDEFVVRKQMLFIDLPQKENTIRQLCRFLDIACSFRLFASSFRGPSQVQCYLQPDCVGCFENPLLRLFFISDMPFDVCCPLLFGIAMLSCVRDFIKKMSYR